MMASNDKVPLTAECLCKKHKFTTAVPCASLPLQATTCHCDSCRHFTGALYSIDAPWPEAGYEAIRQSTLKWYDFSANLKILFCGTCSSGMFWESPLRDPQTNETVSGKRKFTVFVGALSHDGGGEPPEENLVEIGAHMFVGDTKDGGASMWMRRLHGEGKPPVKRFAGMKNQSEELAEDWPAGLDTTTTNALTKPTPGASEQEQKHQQEDVPIQCHCGGVDLVFRRAEAEREWTATTNPEDLPRIVDPQSRKYVAGLDACNSCRLSFGADFSTWAFVFLRHLGFLRQSEGQQERESFPKTLADLQVATEEEEGGKPSMGTLAMYRSSSHVQRYFCSRCSATVFYTADGRNKHPDLVDLAIGVLRADEGARAERSFRWLLGGPIQHREDMLVNGGWRAGWLQAVEAEAEAWRKERGFPEWWCRR